MGVWIKFFTCDGLENFLWYESWEVACGEPVERRLIWGWHLEHNFWSHLLAYLEVSKQTYFLSQFCDADWPCEFVCWWVNLIIRAFEGLGSKNENRGNPDILYIRCKLLDLIGWIKGNTDAMVYPCSSSMACGGLLRDSNGIWKRGFAKKLGRCSIFEAELWGIFEGLKLAWVLGFRKIIAESDPLSVVMMINGAEDGGNNMKCIIQIIQWWIRKD